MLPFFAKLFDGIGKAVCIILGFTSFDFMSMLGEIEDTFDVEIEQTKAAEIRTVQEAIDYLETLKDA